MFQSKPPTPWEPYLVDRTQSAVNRLRAGDTSVRVPIVCAAELTKLDGGKVVVVGTSHVSAESGKLVRACFDALDPDAVAVELDNGRAHALMPEAVALDRHARRNVALGPRRLFLLASSMLASSVWCKVAGVSLGEEAKMAMRLAWENQRRLVLLDRELLVTVSRTSPGLATAGMDRDLALAAVWALVRGDVEASAVCMEELVGRQLGLLESYVSPSLTRSVLQAVHTTARAAAGETVPREELEAARRYARTEAEEMIAQAAFGGAPRTLLGEDAALTTEREELFADRLHCMAGDRILAIVGSNHVRGIVSKWGQTERNALIPYLDPPPNHARDHILLPGLGLVGFSAGMWSLSKHSPKTAKAIGGTLALTTIGLSVAALRATNTIRTLVDNVETQFKI